MLGRLCGFSQNSEALPEWTIDGLQLLENLHGQLVSAEVRSAPLLQRLFQGAHQPFGEALAEWLFHGEAMPHPDSPFAAELPSDLRDLLPEQSQPEVSLRLGIPYTHAEILTAVQLTAHTPKRVGRLHRL